jgi:hypothetical protein
LQEHQFLSCKARSRIYIPSRGRRVLPAVTFSVHTALPGLGGVRVRSSPGPAPCMEHGARSRHALVSNPCPATRLRGFKPGLSLPRPQTPVAMPLFSHFPPQIVLVGGKNEGKMKESQILELCSIMPGRAKTNTASVRLDTSQVESCRPVIFNPQHFQATCPTHTHSLASFNLLDCTHLWPRPSSHLCLRYVGLGARVFHWLCRLHDRLQANEV